MDADWSTLTYLMTTCLQRSLCKKRGNKVNKADLAKSAVLNYFSMFHTYPLEITSRLLSIQLIGRDPREKMKEMVLEEHTECSCQETHLYSYIVFYMYIRVIRI